MPQRSEIFSGSGRFSLEVSYSTVTGSVCRTRPGFLNNLQEIYTSVNSSAYKLQNYTKNAFFMSHWGENEQRFSYQAPTITDLLLFYFPFPGEMYWPPPRVTGPQWEGWRHPSILVFRLPERFEEEAGAQGIPIPATWKPCHSLFTALPRLCETRPFFPRAKNTWFYL